MNDCFLNWVRSLRSVICLFFLIAICIFDFPAYSQSTLSNSIADAIQPLIKNHQGDVTVAVYHFESDTHWSIRGDVVMPTASLIKLPVMVEAYRQVAAGRVKLEQRIELRKEDMVQGSGILTNHFSPGTSLSLRDAIRLMIVYSDNTATNLVVDAIGLPATTLAMKELGYPETQLNAKVFRRDLSIAPERSEKYGLGSTTALDMVRLVTRLKRGELATPESTEAMLDHLLHCDDKSRFPLLLPAKVKVAHKTGSVTRVRTDAGLLMGPGCTIALCVLTDNNKDIRWTDDNAGNKLSADIAKTVYDLLSPKTLDKDPSTSVAKAMRIGATGDLVESLQRTLKVRLSPRGSISVDGDFGPATEAAVKAFQKQEKIEATGVVNEATWTALGALIEQDQPLPPPHIVNSEKLEKKPSDDPFGPPQVTCTAWTIVDGASGDLIATNKSEAEMHIASTTKIMTAYLVLKLAAVYPEVLDEVLTFSRRADETIGSTAGVRAGESLTVNELMYGLLLPSGNDASVALAEHFGRKFAKPDAELDDKQSFDRFMEQMNETARELNMLQTNYVNPHGLTDKAHLSSATDLARLARAALELPRFRDYVTCRQHGCEVIGTGGYKRNLKWENTNRLLSIDGYMGLKTGTTDAAGACLVSCSQRDGRELIVVVLNAANSDARYLDARNLHAFGWRKLGNTTQ
ncbi:MAG TPA: serine hydrolase [Pirellula sp.]|nr:serine hydrolase [Pirellula sp.]